MVDYVKLTHISCAIVTALLFIARGVWMIRESPLLETRASKIVPHVIDTVLLASAAVMLFQYRLNPLHHSWLMAKILVLPVYIALGMMAFRFGKTRSQKIMCWVAALVALLCIYGFAISKRVIFW